MNETVFDEISTYIQKHDFARATALCHDIVRTQGENSQVYNLLGFIAAQTNQADQAIAYLNKATALSPQDARLHANLAQIYLLSQQPQRAIESFEKAAALLSRDPMVYKQLANLYEADGNIPGMIRNLRQIVILEPKNINAHVKLLTEQQKAYDWSDTTESIAILKQELHDAVAQKRNTAVTPLVVFRLFPEPTLLLQAAALRSLLYAQLAEPIRQQLVFTPQTTSTQRIKIGYLSPNFGDYALGHLFHRLLHYHNKDQFEIYIYSYRENAGGEIYTSMQQAVDHFVDISKAPADQAAKRIHDDGIQILVDLKGYAGEGMSMMILALRPAPIQIAYLEYLATTGASFVDYIIADKHVIPKRAQQDYSEKILYLPDTFQPNDDQPLISEQPMTREAVGLPRDAVVYCAFHQSFKIDNSIFTQWLAVLKAVPHAVLWLLSDATWKSDILRQAAAQAGVDPTRLIFAPYIAKPQHLARLALADVYLDSYCTNAGATASDALYMGVPMITCPGNTFATRIGLSVLNAIGLKELVAKDLHAYTELAITLGNDATYLQKMKRKLQRNKMTYPLFDTQRYTGCLEQAYQMVWEEYCEGNASS